MEYSSVSIVVPVYNEISTIDKILEMIDCAKFNGLQKEIILVDDCSVDGSREKLEELSKQDKYKVLFHNKNKGKGAALRTGFGAATADIILIQDADLEYDPEDYTQLIKLIVENRADVVYGSRLSGGKSTRSFMFTHLMGNKLLTFMTNLLYNTTLTDMETCYKAFKAEVLKNIIIKSDRFDFEPEITAKVLKKGYKLYETPISYYGRDYSEGKKITWFDGLEAVWTLIKYRFVD